MNAISLDRRRVSWYLLALGFVVSIVLTFIAAKNILSGNAIRSANAQSAGLSSRDDRQDDARQNSSQESSQDSTSQDSTSQDSTSQDSTSQDSTSQESNRFILTRGEAQTVGRVVMTYKGLKTGRIVIDVTPVNTHSGYAYKRDIPITAAEKGFWLARQYYRLVSAGRSRLEIVRIRI